MFKSVIFVNNLKPKQMKKEELVDVLPKSETIYTKLWKAKQEIGKVTKGSNNPFFKSKYADLNAILEATEPILLKHGLLLLQPVLEGKLCTQIIDIDNGDRIESSLVLPMITDPQKLIASITYYRRGSLQTLLSLQAIDDDGNTAREAVSKLFPQERFESGLLKLSKGELTTDQFKSALKGFELTDVQTKAIEML